MLNKSFLNNIFQISSDAAFQQAALQLFAYQYQHNPIYQQFSKAIHKTPDTAKKITDIPYLPISFFKFFKIETYSPSLGELEGAVFESSGTSGTLVSKHYVKDVSIYEKSFITNFEQVYGNIDQYCIIGLLPSYLERQNASLVYMVKELIYKSKHVQSGFYLHNYEELYQTLLILEAQQQPTILMGVTFALLDFTAKYQINLKHTIIIETGGMKGRQKELTRQQVHHILCSRLGVQHIHSEYGMTELLSQTYATHNGIFTCPPWMQVLIRNEQDPLEVHQHKKLQQPVIGAINIIDLANIYSCAFIATEDMGTLHPNGQFEVLGRLDNTDTRGCSLMIN